MLTWRASPPRRRAPQSGSVTTVTTQTIPAHSSAHDILDRIATRKARVGVIGLGYVGLPLAVEFARSGFEVTGFDVDPRKIAEINRGVSYIGDVESGDVAEAVEARRLRATTDMADLEWMDAIDICVPTPLRK